MNENENENIFPEEDIILPEDFEDTETLEDEGSTQNEESETQASGEDTSNNVTDEQKILDFLNAKEIKYNGEAVKLDSLDKFIDTFQKGMNYDNLKAKQEKSENIVMNYVTEMAKKMGLTPEQYIDKVKAYEEEQIKAQNEQAIQSMMSNGVPEDIAREVIETRALRKKLEKEQVELNEEKEKRKAEAQKEKEYEEFLNAYPGIEVDKIPEEVFENAKNSNLKSAYAEYENKILKEKIKQMEQNANNASSSVVTPTSDGSSVEQQSKDAFLIGFEPEE